MIRNIYSIVVGFVVLTSIACSQAENVKSPSPSVASQTAALKSDWNVRDHVPLEKIKVQSHRGAGVLAPENTIEAFELGWKIGTIPESDVRVTKDGVIVAFHDNDFSRVVKDASEELQKKGVRDITWDELSKLDVGAYRSDRTEAYRVRKLTEVFALMKDHPERHLYLDIKEVDLPQLAAEVKQFKVEKQVIFTSTKYELHRAWKKLVPESQDLLWMGGDEKTLKKRFEELRAANFADLTQLQIHIRLPNNPATKSRTAPLNPTAKLSDDPEPFNVPKKFLLEAGKEVRAHGIIYQALPWDTRDPKVFWTLMDLGFGSFSTDYPDSALQAIKEYYAAK